MLKIDNSIQCPGCQSILRTSVRLVSDGSPYEFYLCPRCQAVATQDPQAGGWKLGGGPAPWIAGALQALQALATEEWRARSTARKPMVRT